ncbi:MAG: hypothetical protein ACLRSW_16280 [Christensenellaceae bacterium]
MQSAWEKVHALRRRTQEEGFGSVFMKDTKKPKEREKSKRKNYREYGKISGGKKRLNRGKEIGKMKGRRIYGNISRGIVGRTEKTAK